MSTSNWIWSPEPVPPRRYRLVPHPHPVPGALSDWTLCTPDGARELGIEPRPDDELIVLYPPDISEPDLALAVARLSALGDDVVVDGRISDRQRSLDRWADDGGSAE